MVLYTSADIESDHSHFMWIVGRGPGQTAPASRAGPFMLTVTLSDTVHHSPVFLGGIVECCYGRGRCQRGSFGKINGLSKWCELPLLAARDLEHTVHHSLKFLVGIV